MLKYNSGWLNIVVDTELTEVLQNSVFEWYYAV